MIISFLWENESTLRYSSHTVSDMNFGRNIHYTNELRL